MSKIGCTVVGVDKQAHWDVVVFLKCGKLVIIASVFFFFKWISAFYKRKIKD